MVLFISFTFRTKCFTRLSMAYQFVYRFSSFKLFFYVGHLSSTGSAKGKKTDSFSMPLQSWVTNLQPYPAIFALVAIFLIIMFLGVRSFIQEFVHKSSPYDCLIVFVDIGFCVSWKLFKKTMFVKPEEAD